MNQVEKIAKTIKVVVQEQLKPAHIIDVVVSADVDHDGFDVLKVNVVFTIEGDRLDPDKVLGLVRHLRQPFKGIQENRFPIFSFMKPNEVQVAGA